MWYPLLSPDAAFDLGPASFPVYFQMDRRTDSKEGGLGALFLSLTNNCKYQNLHSRGLGFLDLKNLRKQEGYKNLTGPPLVRTTHCPLQCCCAIPPVNVTCHSLSHSTHPGVQYNYCTTGECTRKRIVVVVVVVVVVPADASAVAPISAAVAPAALVRSKVAITPRNKRLVLSNSLLRVS